MSMDGQTEDIRRRISLRALVAALVVLQRRGKEFVGLCPFHREKTPSFHVVEDKGFYHCFGCGAKGDAFTWLQETQGLTFPQALERLAQQAGVVLKRKPETQQTQQRRQHKDRIHETLTCAEAFYTKALFASEGEKARCYLKQRRLDRACAERFALGWADSNTDAFFEHMRRHKHDDKELLDAGLVVRRQGASLRARFRSRILFPILDAQGRTIAFGGRFLDTDAKRTDPRKVDKKADFTPPKYLNSPETALFTKGQNLYNFARVRNLPRIAQRTPTVLVEGYTDVLALDKAGFVTSLASLGTALSEEQLLLLWQCDEKPVLCFDGDKAGTLAAKRAVVRALPLLDERRTLQLFFLPEGHDPDSFVATFGIEKWRKALEDTESVSAFLWRDERDARRPLQTPEQLAALDKALVEHATAVQAPLLAKHYRAFFKDALFAERRHLNERLKRQATHNTIPFSNDEQHRLRHLQERLLATLASRPQLWAIYEQRFARTALPYDLDAARQAMLLAYEEAPDGADLTQILWQSAGEVLHNIAAQNSYLQGQMSIEKVQEIIEKILLALDYSAMRQDLKQTSASEQTRYIHEEASRIFHDKMQAEH